MLLSLHSLNLVICQLRLLLRNRFAKVFLFFSQLPKRQRFLELVIGLLATESKKKKIKLFVQNRVS